MDGGTEVFFSSKEYSYEVLHTNIFHIDIFHILGVITIP